ncbi:MAG TPA: ATP-binding protein [Pyrinomonadaceae bacterium]
MKLDFLSSMRIRLTLWYTTVLALVLLIFAVTSYSYLARAARQRTDASLSDTLDSLISTFNTELNDEGQTIEVSAQEAALGLHFHDRQLIIYDSSNQVLVASSTPSGVASNSNWFLAPDVSEHLLALTADAVSGRSFSLFPFGREQLRAVASIVPAKDQSLKFVVVNSLRDESQSLVQTRRAFYIAVPLALLIAAVGGYLLARKSLAPVVSMGEQAAHIGAANLSQRIPVPGNNRELGRLAEIFNDLLGRLDKSFAQQKRFMADASHELRTPVAVIVGESEVVLSQPRATDEYRDSLSIVNDEGRRLTRLVEDLFTLARADSGEYPLVMSDFYLDESVNESVRSVRSLAAQKELELLYRPPETEIAYRGDEAVITRMVMNLLQNAIKFTPANGRIEVGLKQNCTNWEISVSDSGEGIPEQARQQVFERFFRVDKVRSRQNLLSGSGAGLGLSIAKWAAELHGGKIVLERTGAHGTTFVIYLPTQANEASAKLKKQTRISVVGKGGLPPLPTD